MIVITTSRMLIKGAKFLGEDLVSNTARERGQPS